jgi:hypothetical protein
MRWMVYDWLCIHIAWVAPPRKTIILMDDYKMERVWQKSRLTL